MNAVKVDRLSENGLEEGVGWAELICILSGMQEYLLGLMAFTYLGALFSETQNTYQ